MNRSHSSIVLGYWAAGAAAMTLGESLLMEVPVVSVQPIVQLLTDKIPHETCRAERVKVVQESGNHSATPGLLGVLIGATAAGYLGNNSRHQPLIAGAGALLGASIGNDYSHKRAASGYYVTEQHCVVDFELREREHVTGYRVSYRYLGELYHTETREHPGSTLSLRVNLQPEE